VCVHVSACAVLADVLK